MVNGNLAYKDDYTYKPIKPQVNKKRQPTSVRTDVDFHAEKPALKKEVQKRKQTLNQILYVALIAFSATFMISKYVSVNDTTSKIRSLNKELTSARDYTSQRIYEMERSVDLSEVEEIATTKLGMQRPESYQIIYVNVDRDDHSELTANDVEGAGNKMKGFWDKVKENILELFSIE